MIFPTNDDAILDYLDDPFEYEFEQLNKKILRYTACIAGYKKAQKIAMINREVLIKQRDKLVKSTEEITT